MIIDHDEEPEYEPKCDCGKIDCHQCNRENFRPLTELEQKAQDLLTDKNFIIIKNESYRFEEILENENVRLISNNSDENSLDLDCREVSFIEEKILHFKDPDDIDYTVIIEDEDV
jgi:hypothetical protein